MTDGVMNQDSSAVFSCRVRDLGLIDYEEAYLLQKEAVAEVIAGKAPAVFFCEHPTVLTLGRLAAQDNILVEQCFLERQGIKVLEVDRGGEVTVHCPGQLVVYPIFDLKNYQRDLKLFLYKLEQVAIDFFKEFDILAGRIPGRTGVWVSGEKIVSAGIGVRKWVSFHGLGINLNTDLANFSFIRPCGLNVRMTSLNKLLGKPVELARAKKMFINVFLQEFCLTAE